MLISGNATIAAPASRARSMKPSMDRTLRSGLPARTSICASATVGRAAGTAGFAGGSAPSLFWLERKGLPRWLAMLVVIGVIITVVFILFEDVQYMYIRRETSQDAVPDSVDRAGEDNRSWRIPHRLVKCRRHSPGP